MTDRAITLGDYPLVIEPTVSVLEFKIGGEGVPERQAHLHRIPTHVVLSAVELPNSLVHFFGLSEELAENEVILCYSTAGRLTHVLKRGDDEWHLSTVPAEITGDAVLLPSVRLVFKDERARQVFLHHMQQIVDGKSHHPQMSLLLEQLAEPIRIVDVWSQTDEG